MKTKIGNMSILLFSLIQKVTLRYQCLRDQDLTVPIHTPSKHE